MTTSNRVHGEPVEAIRGVCSIHMLSLKSRSYSLFSVRAEPVEASNHETLPANSRKDVINPLHAD